MASFGVFDSFFIIKTSQEWGKTFCSPWKSKLKLNYMKNPSFGELQSLYQINQVCKEENQRRNLTFNNFAAPCEIFASLRIAQEGIPQALRNWEWISQPLAKFSQARRNFASLTKPKLRKINFASQNEFHKPCETNEFCNPLQNWWILQPLAKPKLKKINFATLAKTIE